MMAPAVTVNVLFAVIGSLTTYNLIYILTDGQFGTNTLGILAFNSAFGASADLGLGRQSQSSYWWWPCASPCHWHSSSGPENAGCSDELVLGHGRNGTPEPVEAVNGRLDRVVVPYPDPLHSDDRLSNRRISS